MNKELEGTPFQIPDHILGFIKQQPDDPNVDRNKNLLATGYVEYGQLKRILHDMKTMDKKADPGRYNLYGGQPLEDWGWSILKQNRDTIKKTKQSKKIANDIAGMGKNPHNKTHTKTMSPRIGVNDINKRNSEKWSGSSEFSADSMKLTEEINRMINLMI